MQFHHLSSVFCLVACENSRSVMILNVFFFQPALMLLRLIALCYLYLFLYQREKISQGTSFASLVFSGGFFPSLQDKLTTLFICCENQSKKILFVISKPFLEYRTIQESSEKEKILLNCNLPVNFNLFALTIANLDSTVAFFLFYETAFIY